MSMRFRSTFGATRHFRWYHPRRMWVTGFIPCDIVKAEKRALVKG